MTNQRIYIGGIHPNQLPISTLLSRIAPDYNPNNSNISIHDNNHSSSYLFITYNTIKEAEEVIREYNNVKWRGCRLIVEFAKMSFMERLEAERRMLCDDVVHRNRDAFKGDAHDSDDYDVGKNAKEVSVERRRSSRYLKIRNKIYNGGKEKLKIDTKPIDVRVTLDSANIRRNSSQAFYKDVRSKKKIGMHNHHTRAIHVVFDYKEDSNNNIHDDVYDNDDDDDDSSNDDDGKDEGIVVGSYKWSSSSSESDEDEKYSLHEFHGNDVSNAVGKYVWSSDDDSNVDDNNNDEHHHQEQEQKQIDGENYNKDLEKKDREKSFKSSFMTQQLQEVHCCEFTSGLDDNYEDHKYSHDDDAINIFKEEEEEIDLDLEKEQSMKILRSLFPDLKPRKEKKQTNVDADARIIIPRFDPTNFLASENITPQTKEKSKSETLSSQEQIEYEAKINEGDNYSDERLPNYSGEDGDDGDDVEETMEEAGNLIDEKSIESIDEVLLETNQQKKCDIYQQKVLEGIFQRARGEVKENETVEIKNEASIDVNPNSDSTNAGAFSFGFSFVNKNDEEALTMIADEKVVKSKKIENTLSVTLEDEDYNLDVKKMNSSSSITSGQSIGTIEYPRHVTGSLFKIPSEPIMKNLLSSFYALNDIHDVGNKTDDENWNVERKFLTTDWKQKRKRALKYEVSANNTHKNRKKFK